MSRLGLERTRPQQSGFYSPIPFPPAHQGSVAFDFVRLTSPPIHAGHRSITVSPLVKAVGTFRDRVGGSPCSSRDHNRQILFLKKSTFQALVKCSFVSFSFFIFFEWRRKAGLLPFLLLRVSNRLRVWAIKYLMAIKTTARFHR